jgi:hypothetical protein
MILLLILGVSCLNTLSYESPYQMWLANKLIEKKPDRGLRLFLLQMIQCLGCYSFWYNIPIYFLFGFGWFSPILSAISSVLGVLILKKYKQL